MSQNPQILFKNVVEHVFNNWTALQLAVEHQMGGPTSRQTALEAMTWVTEYCLSQTNLQIDDLTEALEDILDEEYELICEDDSPKQVAHVLIKFLQLLHDGHFEQFQSDFSCLPTCKIWLSQPQETTPRESAPEDEESTSTTTTTSTQDMDVDPEWTTVVHKRKK